MSAIDDLFKQLEQDSTVLDTPLLGLERIGNDPLSRPALDLVFDLRDRMQKRKQLIAAFVAAGRALVQSGYPAPVKPRPTHEQAEEIAADVRLINAAADLFEEERAANLGLQAEPPLLKEN